MISLQPVPPSDTTSLWFELGIHAPFRRAFPYIRHTLFQQSVITANQIQDDGNIRGILLQTKPTPEFRIYGDRESLLLIYPQYQRQGIGTQVVSLIHEDKNPTFFVSSKSNPTSTVFFQKQQGLKLVDDTERFSVYSRP